MKKNVLLATGIALSLAAVSTANAEGLYVGGNLGVGVTTDSTITDATIPGVTIDFKSDSGVGLGFVLGYDYGDFRTEAEIAYQKNNYKEMTAAITLPLSGDVSSLAFLINGYYDFHNNSPITPFVGGGIGYAKVTVSDLASGATVLTAGDNDSALAYHVGVGASYGISETVAIDLKYRYFATQDLTFSVTTNASYSSHNFYAGTRISF